MTAPDITSNGHAVGGQNGSADVQAEEAALEPPEPTTEKVVSVASLSYMQSPPKPLETPVTPATPAETVPPLSANYFAARPTNPSNLSDANGVLTSDSHGTATVAGASAMASGASAGGGGPDPNDFPFPQYQPLAAIGETGSPEAVNAPSEYTNLSTNSTMKVPPLPTATATPTSSAPTSAPPSRRPSTTGVAPSSEAATKRGRSQSSSKVDASGKPVMLGQTVGQKSSAFIARMFHKEDKSPNGEKPSRSGSANGVNGAGQHGRGLNIDLPRSGISPSGVSSPAGSGPVTESPPMTPGSPALSQYGGSESASNNPSQAPSRATSVKRDGPKRSQSATAKSPSLHPSDAHAIAPGALADRLSSQASISTVGPQSPPISSGNEHKFNLKDLLQSGPKLARKASAGSAASKSERAKSNNGSEKGGHDGASTASLLAKYGVCEKAAIGKGATAVVRLAHKWDRREEKLYAVKEFRKRRKNETEKDYVKKLTSEFCISSTLHHPNIVETVDLVQDEAQHWCEVMEYCPGGDLYAAIKKGTMSTEEIECYFKQILDGVAYLHSTGVAHRDIKPENLLLDGRGRVKITDFGVSDVFRMCWEKKTHLSKGLCGSEPYIAPEQFEQKEYDARLVDVWACGVVFYCMQLQELPWGVARKTDRSFITYVGAYHSEHAHAVPAPLNNLPRESRAVIKHMLDPDPKTRWGIEDCLKDKWLVGIDAKRQVKEIGGPTAV